VQVFLDGKDEEGRTKYLNEDGTKHIHKTTATAAGATRTATGTATAEFYNNSNRMCFLKDDKYKTGSDHCVVRIRA
jgi:hypothetical protein